MSAVTNGAADIARLDKAQAGKVTTLGGALAAVGILLSVAGAVADKEKFAFAYLTGFMWVMTIALGGLFFVVIQHLTRAGWSVAARRQAEWLAGFLPVGLLLFIPVGVFSHDLYEHWMNPEAANDPLLQSKIAHYLNPTFFFIRVVVYFGIWTALSMFFRGNSARQDETGDKSLTLKMQRLAPVAVLLYALSQTFAAFDWVMSLDPHWYSTIFGVYIFAGSAVACMASLALMTIQLQRKGLFNKVSTVEHQHDIGKLLFGFTVFWTYIAFSQYFLIWYANLPEETEFFTHRQHGGWGTMTNALAIGHFIIPFALLLSRTAKRTRLLLGIGAVWMLFMHWVDLYWLIMPNHDTHGVHFSWIDVAGLMGPLGILAFWLAQRASKDNLYPVKDPRLEETYRVNNP